MQLWHDFLDSLDSDGGHVFLLLLLMAVGMVGVKLSVAKSEDVIAGAFGALLMTLKDAGSNKDRSESQTTITKTATATVTSPEVKN